MSVANEKNLIFYIIFRGYHHDIRFETVFLCKY